MEVLGVIVPGMMSHGWRNRMNRIVQGRRRRGLGLAQLESLPGSLQVCHGHFRLRFYFGGDEQRILASGEQSSLPGTKTKLVDRGTVGQSSSNLPGSSQLCRVYFELCFYFGEDESRIVENGEYRGSSEMNVRGLGCGTAGKS